MSDVVGKYVFNDCVPLVQSGNPVSVKVSQTMTGAGNEVLVDVAGTVKFSVEGPRYQLDAHDVAGMYPAPESRESPADFVPHIAIRRRTLPWERIGPKASGPWVALLMLNDVQFVQEHGKARLPIDAATVRAKTVHDLDPADPLVTALHKSGGPVDDKAAIQVLTIPNVLLKSILPFPEELALLCHMKRTTRQVAVKGADGKFAPTDEEEDAAIVICNQLPDATVGTPAPVLHFVFLVSLENRDDVYALDPKKTTSLIVLYQWKFTPAGGGDFEDVMQGIRYGQNGGVLRFGNLPQTVPQGQGPLHSSFASALSETGRFIKPLEHTQAQQANYHGPLVPFVAPLRNNSFAVRSSPEEFDPPVPGAPLDYSNATAFEVGRLMAIAENGLLDDIRSIHMGWWIPIPRYVDLSNKPLALETPDWIVDPAMQGVDRFTVASTKQSLTAGSDLLTHNQGDYSGVAMKQWANVTLASAVSSVVQVIDISTLTPDTAGIGFHHVVTASGRSG